MAVFTPVSLEQLSTWIMQFPLGKAHAIHNISSGIENSNFFIDTDKGQYVLTLFECLSPAQLPFYLELMQHLAHKGIAVPNPVANRDGHILDELNNKPACIVTKLKGKSELNPQPVHCRAVGDMLAKMHLAGKDYTNNYQPNLRGLDWWKKTVPLVLPYLPADIQDMLEDELHFQEEFAVTQQYKALPTGPSHNDLFRNNVMFDGEQLTGFFDFYFAGWDTWLFDLAVTANDWCIDLGSGEWDHARLNALLDAYQAVRPLTEEEIASWHAMLRAAALRFWISRLYDFYLPREAETLTPHDPTHFERILRLRRTHPDSIIKQ